VYGLGEDDFEELCCALLYYEDGLENADLYNRPRRMQFGVDSTADYKDGSGIAVISSKCYKTVRPGQIQIFAQEFLQHWESRWSTKRVQRFILCVSVDLRGEERREEIEYEKQRFSSLGVKFEAWGTRQLSQRARTHPEIGRAFFETRVVETALSGPSQFLQPTAAAQTLIPNIVVQQLAALRSTVEKQLIAELDGLQSALKRGQRDEVRTPMLSKLRDLPRMRLLLSDHTHAPPVLTVATDASAR
jgi:hypothetical protein